MNDPNGVQKYTSTQKKTIRSVVNDLEHQGRRSYEPELTVMSHDSCVKPGMSNQNHPLSS